MAEIKRQLVAFINGASPRIARFLFGRMATPSEAEINKELAEKYGRVAGEMKRERESGGPTLSPAGEETVSILRDFLETEDTSRLKDAEEEVRDDCKSCAENIKAAREAYSRGDIEESKELIYGLIGALTIGQKFKGGARE